MYIQHNDLNFGHASIKVELEHCRLVTRNNTEEVCASETDTNDYWVVANEEKY